MMSCCYRSNNSVSLLIIVIYSRHIVSVSMHLAIIWNGLLIRHNAGIITQVHDTQPPSVDLLGCLSVSDLHGTGVYCAGVCATVVWLLHMCTRKHDVAGVLTVWREMPWKILPAELCLNLQVHSLPNPYCSHCFRHDRSCLHSHSRHHFTLCLNS